MSDPIQYYDLNAARAHGIPDTDILNELAAKHNYDLAGAREHGISDADILNTLVTTKPPAEPVVEKESPEIIGGLGGAAGAVGAAGDVIYSKGRPLIRMAEKMMGKEPSTPVAKPRTFLDPTAVAQQAIDRRTVSNVPEGSTTTVRNWTAGRPGEGAGQHAGEFLGGANYSEADKIAKEAREFELANPGRKVLPGSLIAVPEHEARNLAQQRAALAAQEDAVKQAEVQAVAQKRAERLGERSALKHQQSKYDVAKGTAGIAGKVAIPIIGGYEAGAQGAQAYNRLTRPDLTPSDVASGVSNVIGSTAGAASMLPNKNIKIKGVTIPTKGAAALISQGAGALANVLDKRNPRNEPVEEKAVGGLAGYSTGKKVLAEKTAKKGAELVKGYLHNTAINPNELVGTRFKTTDLGGLIKPYEFDPSKYMGAKIIHRPYDLSSRNQLVEEISGHKLINPVRTEGGQAFGRDIENQAIGLGGASNKGINDRILKRVDAAAREGNGQVLHPPSSMSFGSEAFTPMPISIQRDILAQREFSPETIARLNEQVRSFDPKKLQNFLGFEHPEVEKQLLEGGYGLNTTPGKLRIAASNRLGLKENQKLLDYNIEDLYHALRDPSLRNTPPGFMGETVMEAQPFTKGFEFGRHSAYDSGDASKYVGRGVNAPISVWMPDTYKEALARLKAEQPEANLTNLRSQARNILGTQETGVAQTMNQQVVDNLGRYKEAVEAGKLDPNNLDEIHKYIYGNKAGEYAEGGEVQHFADGRIVLAKNIAEMIGKPSVNRISMHFKDVIKRTPQITEAARLLKEGKLSREEFDQIVNQFKPVTPYNFVPQPATEAEAMDALGKKGIGKWKLDLPEGHPVDLRLDIPAYKDKGVWVNSIHNAGQKNVIPDTSYSNIAAARDVGFEITPRNQERFLNYAADLEGQNKFTGARMHGLWTPMDDKDFIEKSQDALHSKDWTQIGMDPERHGYFYDRTSMEPIAKTDEVLQVGPLVLGKNPKYGNKKDSLYKKGGLAALKKKKK